MFELDKILRDTCHVCGKKKTIGLFCIESTIQVYHVPICSPCLDNASRLICKKADRITWNRQAMKLENVYRDDMLKWDELYPDVDVIDVIEKRIPEWIIKKILSGKAVKKDYRRFIMNWLKREQIKAVGL